MEKSRDKKNRLLVDLIDEGYLKTSNIIKAFQNIDRKDFILEKDGEMAYIDSPLSIGYGQTISQPAVVALMIELLQPQSRDRILDIGSGSGWTTALLSHIVSQNNQIFLKQKRQNKEKGIVIAIETISGLKEFGEKNTAKYNFVPKIAKFICEDGKKGYLQNAPYNRILVSASATSVSKYWKEQLVVNGIIVACIGNSIWKVTKKSDQEFEKIKYPGFVFVPLV